MQQEKREIKKFSTYAKRTAYDVSSETEKEIGVDTLSDDDKARDFESVAILLGFIIGF